LLLTKGLKIIKLCGNIHAWNGNKGVDLWILTLLTSFLTPGMEIKGVK